MANPDQAFLPEQFDSLKSYILKKSQVQGPSTQKRSHTIVDLYSDGAPLSKKATLVEDAGYSSEVSPQETVKSILEENFTLLKALRENNDFEVYASVVKTMLDDLSSNYSAIRSLRIKDKSDPELEEINRLIVEKLIKVTSTPFIKQGFKITKKIKGLVEVWRGSIMNNAFTFLKN